ncbi:Nuclease HARBI1 [Oopsacas minuta]|uniref:Nuclease HARBI1 n=1 Tax=Oopsacas minuta TaxID=111878 RepID=A0AAV7KAG7_9METZ|nr:Nuclease HARBI1 [Oopsacas minuta]
MRLSCLDLQADLVQLVTTQLAVTLQILATDSFQTVVASAHGISQPFVSNFVRGVRDVLCSIAKEYIQFQTAARQMGMQHGLMEKFGFPKVLGCIDGTHIPIVPPSTNEEIYVNLVEWPGITHDAFIWRQLGIKLKITSKEIPIIDGWFLGDSGFPLRPNLMTPLLSPVTPRERRYNRAFLKTRKTIECSFGIWKSRWRSMDKTGGSLCYRPERVCKLILSSMILHNLCVVCCLQIDIENLESDMPYTETEDTEHSDNRILVRENIFINYFT